MLRGRAMQVPPVGLPGALVAFMLPAWPQSGGTQPVRYSLPGVLFSREPGVIVEPLSTAALDAGGRAWISLHGYSWTTTRYRLSGIDVTDPYQPGRLLAPADVQALAPPVIAPHGEILLAIPEPNGPWHGRFAADYTASWLAFDNLPSAPLRGFVQRPDQFQWWTRNHLEAGGPIGRRVNLLLSATGQWASESVPEEPGPENLRSRGLLGNARAIFRANARQRMEAAFGYSRRTVSGWELPAGFEALAGRRMAPPLRPSRELEGDERVGLVQVAWTRSAPAAAQLRWGCWQARPDTRARAASSPTYIELTTGAVAGPPPLATQALYRRHSFQGVFEPDPVRFLSRNHRLRVSAEWQFMHLRHTYTAPGGVHAVTAAGLPAFLVELNTPLERRDRLRALTLLLEDRVALVGSLSATAAVWLDSSRAGAPAVISWRHAAPRLGLALRLGPVVLSGAFHHTYVPPAGRYLDYAGHAGLGGLEFRWSDSNGDRLFQPREKGALLRRFGGPFAGISPALRRPYADELAASAEAALPGGIFAKLRLFRRDDKDRLALLNTGVPFTSFRPRVILDPGPDFLPGTFDDQRLTVFEQDPATFGRDYFLLANPGLRTLSAGLLAEVGLTRPAFRLHLSFLAAKSFGPNNPGNESWENDPGVVGALYQDPNSLLHASGRAFFDRAYGGKLLASWRAPRRLGGFETGSVVTYLDGLAFGRRLLVTDLAQGPLLVAATVRGSPEGGHRTQYYLNWDLRLSRRFGRAETHVDIFNVLNRAGRLREDDLSGPRFNQRLPLAIQPARRLGLGFAYYF